MLRARADVVKEANIMMHRHIKKNSFFILPLFLFEFRRDEVWKRDRGCKASTMHSKHGKCHTDQGFLSLAAPMI